LTIEQAIDKYLVLMSLDPNGRFASFEHFHKAFLKAYREKNPDVVGLTLHLFAFLASWGMLRGSTFSLEKDYLFHKPIVDILLDKKYFHLIDISAEDITEKDIDLIFDLDKRISDYYMGQFFYEDFDGETGTPCRINISNVSATLTTKILMGSFACVPAYDNNFVIGLRMDKKIRGIFNKESLKELLQFYNDNKSEIDIQVRKCEQQRRMRYSEMKILDMYFWEKGRL